MQQLASRCCSIKHPDPLASAICAASSKSACRPARVSRRADRGRCESRLPPRLSSARFPARRCQRKTREIEPRRHDAADQRPARIGSRCLPSARCHNRLWRFAGKDIGTQSLPCRRCCRAGCHAQHQRRPGVPAPDFISIDPVPVRRLPSSQQEMDRGNGASLAIGGSAAESLAVPAAFGMRCEAKRGNDRSGVTWWKGWRHSASWAFRPLVYGFPCSISPDPSPCPPPF